MKAAEAIFRFLADRGVDLVFLIPGGGAMHLDDAIGRESRLRYVCPLHEQACTMAAEGYARVSGRPGVCCVTSGPGGTNAITGVLGAWTDSIPMLILSGQVKQQTTIRSVPDLPLRQLGDQEADIVSMVRPITKYAAMVTDPASLGAELAKAWHLCRTGRPGPVWLDIPLDVQASEVDWASFCQPEPAAPEWDAGAAAAAIAAELQRAERPVIVAGNGVRLAGQADDFADWAERLRIPVLTAIGGIDLLPSEHPFFFGRPGIMGARAANFILQNADVMLVLGARMGLRLIGFDWASTGRAARKIMVDIDAAELAKPTFRPDRAIHADLAVLLPELRRRLPELPESPSWLAYCRRLRERYPVVLPEQRRRTDYVSSYHLPELVSAAAPENSIIVTGNGTAYTSTFQSLPVRRGMRVFANQGCASMGYDLPAAIGAALAAPGRTVICFTGDGSLQMNLQELQTLKNLALPVKLLVYNNAGYLSIRHTQRGFFGGNLVGSDASSGLLLPEWEKLAAAYGLPFVRFRDHREAAAGLAAVLSVPGPYLVEVMTDPCEILGPKAASRVLPDGTMVSAPLEDLAPFLPREEWRENMIVPPIEGDEK